MKTLAYVRDCVTCGQEIVLAICRDGRYRAFERRLQPVPSEHAWAWRKRIGMEETDVVRGHMIHFCAGYRDGVTTAVDRFGTVVTTSVDSPATPREESQ